MKHWALSSCFILCGIALFSIKAVENGTSVPLEMINRESFDPDSSLHRRHPLPADLTLPADLNMFPLTLRTDSPTTPPQYILLEDL